MFEQSSPFLDESPLQTALRSGMTLAQLKDDLGIKSTRHPIYSNLILFVYSQIDSPKMNPIVQASRGHILDENNNWSHVCRPFDRFLNLGEGVPGITQIPDPSKSVVWKKEDGSLVNVWFYNDKWHASTKGSPDAGGNVGDFPFTFSSLFWKTFNEMGLKLPPCWAEDLTFTFELLCAENRVVCPQAVNKIILLAVRDNFTGAEQHPEIWAEDFSVCGSFDEINTLDQMKNSFLQIPALDLEGYVVAQYCSNGAVIRSKVKHPGYVALAHLKGEGSSRKGILELVRMGEGDEFLSVYPESRALFEEVFSNYENFVQSLETFYESVKHIENQKEFALAIKNTKGFNFLFTVRKTGTSIRSILANSNINALSDLIFGEA
jgi:hypothetical protein